MLIKYQVDKIVLEMDNETFVGLFRTIGSTNSLDRMTNKGTLLTLEESNAVSDAYVLAAKDIRISEDRH